MKVKTEKSNKYDNVLFRWYIIPRDGYSKDPYFVRDNGIKNSHVINKNLIKYINYHWNIITYSRDNSRRFTKEFNNIISKNYKESFNILKSKNPIVKYGVNLIPMLFSTSESILTSTIYKEIKFDMDKIKNGYILSGKDKGILFSTLEQINWFIDKNREDFDKIKNKYCITI